MTPRITVPVLRARKASQGRGERIAMVTAYDATFARMMDAAEVDAILIGDSLGMVIQGLDSTLPVTLEEICYHGRAVARGTKRAHRIGDMPFMSYQASTEQAVVNAGRMVKDGGFESIKLEGGREFAETVERIARAGIPVVGHVGLLPQRVHAMGGFKVQGRTTDEADAILEDAVAIAEAGAFMLVIEGVPTELAARITHAVDIPTIGIGAGPECDGQVLVGYDLLGLNDTMRPKFVKRYDEFFARGIAATRAFVDEVRSGAFPDAEHSFRAASKRSGAQDNAVATEMASRDSDAPLPLTEAHAYGPTH